MQNITARKLFRMLWHTATKQHILQPSPSQSWSTSATGKKKEQTMTNKTIVATSVSLGLLLIPISFPSFLFISYNLHKRHRVSFLSFRFGSQYFPRCCKGVFSPPSLPNGSFFHKYGRTDEGCPYTHLHQCTDRRPPASLRRHCVSQVPRSQGSRGCDRRH